MTTEVDTLLHSIAQALYEKKGRTILCLDVREICTLTDHFLIAEGNVNKHLQALHTSVKETMVDNGIEILASEGFEEGEWIVSDYGFVVIHLFLPELRDRYRLEELWHQGTLVDLDITMDNTN